MAIFNLTYCQKICINKVRPAYSRQHPMEEAAETARLAAAQGQGQGQGHGHGPPTPPTTPQADLLRDTKQTMGA